MAAKVRNLENIYNWHKKKDFVCVIKIEKKSNQCILSVEDTFSYY